MSFAIRYAIPMNGPGCLKSVTDTLGRIDGVESTEADLSTQEVVVVGKVAPSVVVKEMQSLGRDAFIRGSGTPNSAAVAILETVNGAVKGLARVIEVQPRKVLFDITVDAEFGDGTAGIYAFGDISNPPLSLGPQVHEILRLPKEVGSTVSAWAFVEDTPLSALIGRSVHTESNLTGIIARSAGLWENDKTVCACSGKTVWDEREDFRSHSSGHL